MPARLESRNLCQAVIVHSRWILTETENPISTGKKMRSAASQIILNSMAGRPASRSPMTRKSTACVTARSRTKAPSQNIMFSNYGIIPVQAVDKNQLAALIILEDQAGPLYRLGYYNFYVITRYNRNKNYAMAVYELSQLIRKQYDEMVADDCL